MKARWSGKSLGSRWQHSIFYWLIRVAGLKPGYLVLFFVVSWYALLSPARTRGRAYLARRFPGSGTSALLPHTWKLQWNFGKCLVDRAAAGITGRFFFDCPEKKTLTGLADEGCGVIFLSAHTGCWQMAPYVLSEHSGLPVTVLGHRQPGDIDKQAHEHSGQAAPFRLIGPEQGPLSSVVLLECLRRGELLCMMGDRSFGEKEPVVEVPFLAARAAMPCLAFRLASATGAPVVFAFALRTGPGTGRLCLTRIVRVPEGLGGKAEAYRPYVEDFARQLERFTRRHPYQFFNFFNLWE